MRPSRYAGKKKRRGGLGGLPPHSWEVHPRTNAGEVNRQLLIILVSLGALIVLALLLFFASQFVGKAIEYEAPPKNQAGIFVKGGKEFAGQPFLVPIKVNLETPSVGLKFVLKYDTKLTPDCSNIFEQMDNIISRTTNLTILRENKQCSKGQIQFEYAGLCAPPNEGSTCPNALIGEKTVAKVKFTALQPGNYKLDFTAFDVLSLGTDTLSTNTDLIASGHDAAITVVPAPKKPPEEPVPAAAGGGGSGGGIAWDCPKTWSSCNATNQQSRVCTDRFKPSVTRVEARSCVAPAAPPSTPVTAPVVQKPVQQPVPVAPAKAPVTQKPALVQQPAPVKAPMVQKPAALPLLERVAVLKGVLKGVWQNYKTVIIAVPSALLVLITLLLLVHHFRKPKVVYNIGELKGWIKQEKAMGTSDEDVKQILAQNTGWSKEEIDRAMQEALGTASVPLLPPLTPPS